METIEIKTLIDITKTGVVRNRQGNQQQQDQQKNFTTLLQCLELRSIIIYEDDPSSELLDIKSLGFGNLYKGRQRVWTFRFHPDRSGVYADGSGDKLSGLRNDLHQIPVIKKLTETINMETAVFDLTDPETKNTIIMALSGLN